MMGHDVTTAPTDQRTERSTANAWTDRDRKLWDRIDAFTLDDDASSLTFTRRLARENGWTVSFARSVVEEYKRFVFLACAAGHPVTPSDEVDQAWHLHLTYTRSYWDDLCGEVLGRPLHHGPTKGGSAEGAKFDDWYARTKVSYERFFGHSPPGTIWPSAEIRFGDAASFQRVNRSRYWVVGKPSVGRLGGPVGGGIAALTLTGCAAAAVPAMTLGATTETGLATMLSFAFVAAFVVAILIALIRGSSWGSSVGQRHNQNDHSHWWMFGGFDSESSSGDDDAGGGSSGCGSSGCGSSGCGGGCGGCGA